MLNAHLWAGNFLLILIKFKNFSCEKKEICALSVISSLKFIYGIEWSDKGNYTCKATSSPIINDQKYLAIQSSSTKVSIIHEPVVLNERFQDQALAAAKIGATVGI